MLFRPQATPPPPTMPAVHEETHVDLNFWRRYASPAALAVPFTARLVDQPETIHWLAGEIVNDDPDARNWDAPDEYDTVLTPELRAAGGLR